MPQNSTEAQSVTTRSGSAPLVPVTLAFLAGIIVGTTVRLPSWSLVVVGIVSGCVVLWRWRYAQSGVIALLLLWGCLGALRMAVWEQHPDVGLRELLPDDPQPVRLHGVVVDDPVELFEPGEAHTTEDGDAAGDPDRQVCVLALQHQRTEQDWQPIRGRIRATIQEPRTLLRYGEEILVEGQWFRVPAPGNPGQYNWQAALARKRIHGLVRVRPFDGLIVLRTRQGNPLLAEVVRLRRRWHELLRQHFPERQAGLLQSMLLGQRVALDEGLKDAFVETGTIHLLVISGFNVGLIAGLLELLLRLTGLPWRARLGLIAAGVAVYSALTGFQPPVVRATLMAWIALGASALDRVLSWPNALAAAALAILLIDPVQLFDPSFQLSFGAVASLLAFAGSGQRWLMPRLAWIRVGWLRRYMALSLSATASIWIGLWPVLAWYFFLISPVSMWANVVLAPLISALVVAGTGLLMVATIFETTMRWGSGLLGWLLELTVACIAWCHSIPGGHVYVGRPPLGVVVGYYLLLGISLWRRRWGWPVGRIVLCWTTAIGLWIWSVVVGSLWERRWLQLDVLDVGHGDSLLLRTPAGQTVLIDAGTEEAGRFRVLPALRARGITMLDALVLTHADADHVGGAVPLLQELRVRQLLTNGVPGRSALARRVHRLARVRRVPMVTLRAGASLTGDASVSISALHPPPNLVPDVPAHANDNSIVLNVSMGEVSFLLTGDLEEAGLPVLLGSQAPLRSTVLKVPHHGSRLGEAGERFFRAVAPQLAVLSVGRAHHLPAEETVEALRQVRAVVYSTREQGAIRMRTNGTQLKVHTFH